MPLKTRQNEEITLNLTPMIDVVFLLIIFFMVATKFTEVEHNLELELPQVAGAGESAAPTEPRHVTVYSDGHVELDGSPVTRDELVVRLSEAKSQSDDVEVILQGDGKCEYQHIADTLAACQQARITQIGLSVDLARSMQNSSTRR